MSDWPPKFWTKGFNGRMFLSEGEWLVFQRRQAVRYTDQSLKAQQCDVCGQPGAEGNPLQLAHLISFYHGVHFLGLTPEYLDGPENLKTAHRQNCNKKVELGFTEALLYIRARNVRTLPPFLPKAVLEEWNKLL